MNFSAWDSIPPTKRYNPSLSSAHVIIEFDRTKRIKIFAHKLGQIDFSRDRDINESRQETINREKGNLTLNGFKYKNIGHVYSDPEIIESNSNEQYVFNIYSHGHPLGGTEYGGLESCSRAGLQCADDHGSDGLCVPGKCIIGTITRIKDTKWMYESAISYSPGNLPIRYYFGTGESITLKPILRGKYPTYTNDNAEARIDINLPASIPVKILLPPRFYYSDDFLESLFTYRDERLQQLLNPPINDITGYETRKERFVRKIVLGAYPNSTEDSISTKINSFPNEEIKNSLLGFFKDISKDWYEQCSLIIEEEFLFRFIRQYSTIEYISVVYDRVLKLFSSIIQVTGSSASAPRLSFDKEKISRPVYSRLPGISESYRSDPAFSDKETPSQWLTSGVDDFLSKKKDQIASFYQAYLNPETCSALVLDWLAQHVGLTGTLWNTEWDRKIKEAMIRNAFGWWDREATDIRGNLTPKGSALNQFPFTNAEWTSNPEEANLLSLKLDVIETIKLNNDNSYNSYEAFKTSSENFSELIEVENLKINKLLWNGLIESKGSLLAVCFLVSIFGLKSHSPEELVIVDAQRKILKPKSGLRNAEITAQPLLPYRYQVAQVGTEKDAETGNYTNQLVAGITRVSSVEESRNVFFRVPYYYNRSGKSWDRAIYIAENWMPSHMNVRIQYPYLSADLWSVGDGFFEPDITFITNEEND